MRRFAPLSARPREDTVRGPAMALALHWLAHLPAGADRDQALEQLAASADLAAQAATAGRPV